MTRMMLVAALLLASCIGHAGADEHGPTAKSHHELGWDTATAKNSITRLPLHGQANSPGPFSNRVVFPAGYAGQPHTHSIDLHAVVIRGVSNIAFSSRVDRSGASVVDAGGYLFIPAGTVHYEWFDEPTELHLYGIGPMETLLVEQTD